MSFNSFVLVKSVLSFGEVEISVRLSFIARSLMALVLTDKNRDQNQHQPHVKNCSGHCRFVDFFCSESCILCLLQCAIPKCMPNLKISVLDFKLSVENLFEISVHVKLRFLLRV